MNAPTTLKELLPSSAQGRELAHESAVLHVTGEAVYTDDIPELRGTLYAALVMSPVAHGELIGEGIDRDAILAEHGVVAVFTARDIPGENNCGPIIHDDPFLAVGKVEFLGQAVAVVVARDMLYAREAAKKAKVLVKELPAILTIDEAMEKGSFIMPPKGITRGDATSAMASAPHRVSGRTHCGQQEQFYLEGQITYAVPREDGQLTLYVSTQHPDGSQREAASALNLGTADVEVICRRMGGGFGGKEGNASIFSQSAALAAFKLKRPVKLRVNRDDDMMITGKRHDFRIDYDCGFDDDGRILGIDVVLASRCGYSTDYSGPVNDRAVLHIDNCYYLPNLKIISHRCKTNMQSATAFRGFGGPQGMFGIETVIEEIANKLGKDPLDVRRINLYRDPAVSGNPATMTTQYNQVIEDFVADKIMDQLEVESGYRARREAVRAFNASQQDPQARAGTGAAEVWHLVHRDHAQPGRCAGQHLPGRLGQREPWRYRDGPGPEHQDGPGGRRRAGHSGVTGARHGHRYAEGAQCLGHGSLQRCRHQRCRDQQRLRPVAWAAGCGGCAHARLHRSRIVQLAGGQATGGGKAVAWAALVKQAWLDRVGLGVTGFYMTPDIKYDFMTLQGRAFYYFCYGAAVTEVEVDNRTGEWWLKAVDIVHDVGRSINPAIDRGQIEGAYIQGMGWLTMEECVWDKKGKLLTHGPSTYKIPVASDVPEHFKVSLFDGENVKPTPFRSKAVGEPPLMLALSAYFAVRDAVAANGGYQAVCRWTRRPRPSASCSHARRRDGLPEPRHLNQRRRSADQGARPGGRRATASRHSASQRSTAAD
jgi:xanthine dehydrogenase large subunit